MSPSFLKALFISLIVFGIEGFLLGVGFSFRSKTRGARAAKFLLKGAVYIIEFSIALSLLAYGFIFSEVALLILFIVIVLAELSLEVFFKRMSSAVSPRRAMTKERWQNVRDRGKRQFVLILTFGFGWVLVTPSIVFSVVSPEIVPIYCWAVMILSLALIGLILGNWWWTANEKKFGFRSN